MIRVAHIEPDTIADDLGLPVGLAILRVNGRRIRDSLDLMFYQAEEDLVIEAESPDGSPLVLEIEKSADEPLGIVPEPDKIRRCTNACPFCFVKGNPGREKLRSGLYIKDDDYRLSFLHGHYITLTNLRDEDWTRIFEQRLSPLYVSVHATDPQVRLAMLRNPRAAHINEDLDRLGAGRIAVHAQAVLCPGLNDREQLWRTLDDLYARGADIRSVSVVPVGLTTHNLERGGRPLTPGECRAALETIDGARARAAEERGAGWCYAADELYLQAGLEPPGPDYFDDQELESNGVGAISRLTHRVRSGLDRLPRLEDRRIVAVTGTSLGPTLRVLASEVAEVTGARIDTRVVDNSLYGPMVTTAGLLSGADHLEALESARPFDLALFSAHAINDREIFLDDMSLIDLQARFPETRVLPSEDFIDVLALEGVRAA